MHRVYMYLPWLLRFLFPLRLTINAVITALKHLADSKNSSILSFPKTLVACCYLYKTQYAYDIFLFSSEADSPGAVVTPALFNRLLLMPGCSYMPNYFTYNDDNLIR